MVASECGGGEEGKEGRSGDREARLVKDKAGFWSKTRSRTTPAANRWGSRPGLSTWCQRDDLAMFHSSLDWHSMLRRES
jgi:hypothetical protein